MTYFSSKILSNSKINRKKQSHFYYFLNQATFHHQGQDDESLNLEK